jgi:hypothetical protein
MTIYFEGDFCISQEESVELRTLYRRGFDPKTHTLALLE